MEPEVKDIINDSDYRCIASTPAFNDAAKADIYYNNIDVTYYIIIDETISCGPLTRVQFETMLHAGKDALEDSK